MKLLFTLLAICFSSILEAQSTTIKGLVPVAMDIFDCTGQYDGHFQHPDKCGSFIVCQNNKAFEKDCEACDDLTECPDGIYHFNEVLRRCDFPSRANCGTPKPPPTTSTPKPDENSCPHNCSQKGYCERFSNCDEPEGGWVWDDPTQINWGTWKNYTCGKNLLWHPTEKAPGGFCDFFENLPEPLQILYKRDEECFCPCYWEELKTKEGRCAGKYYYWNRENENDHDLVKEEKMCPKNLYFNPYTNTCDLCKNVRDGECC